MNNSKSFIIFALIIAIVVAVIQLFLIFIAKPNNNDTFTISPERILPNTLDLETIKNIDDRAQKYLSLQYKQLDLGELPTSPTPSVSVTPTP